VETRPTAVPVRAKDLSILHHSKYKERAAYTPAATIKIDIKNKTVVELVIIPVANNRDPKKEMIKLRTNHSVVCVRSANTPIGTPINGRINKQSTYLRWL
jgi:hypothetical protein